ncbi:cobalt-factor II C(20)-methyltransferase [Vibrio salinus]|uniref:cobalt-factor II C(20)-methyltransferase n=1 Tax=Vibrio salinus TaxID=2899784 RepID=UPI001E356941|nr:cobalt-factor II C(20)-methyltransferase [Vibrio salinus]MCE0495673.1 cobalt-factor II C(20)-methyltransferase [Vibrio salinus]
MKTQAKLYAIGTGPGASDLITVRGARLLSSVSVLYTPAGKKGGDSLAFSIVKEYVGEQVEVKTRHFPMSNNGDEKQRAWDSIADEIKGDIESGKSVAFITLGDTMLFSTWVFLLERLIEHIAIEVVPGISSYSAISSQALFPLAMEKQQMAVVPCTASEDKIRQSLTDYECVVLMKVYGRFNRIKALLSELALLPHSLLMANATLENEIVCRDLNEITDEQALPYFSTIIVNKSQRVPL